MDYSDYPHRLYLFRTEESDNSDGKSHYFKICDQSGETVDETKWFQIESGDLTIEVTNLILNVSRDQHLVVDLDPEQDQVPSEDTKREFNQDTLETFTGTGVIVQGPSESSLMDEDDDDLGLVSLSDFGNENLFYSLSVCIEGTHQDDDMYFIHGKGGSRPGLDDDGEFVLTIRLKEDSFRNLKKDLFEVQPDKLNLRLNLEGISSLYSKSGGYFHTSDGTIKHLDSDSNQILNYDDFEPDFLSEIKVPKSLIEKGEFFEFSYSKRLESTSRPTEKEIVHSWSKVDPEEKWRSDVLNSIGKVENKLSSLRETIKQEGERDRGSKWGKEIFDQQKMTNTWLTYLLAVGIVILGFLLGNSPW